MEDLLFNRLKRILISLIEIPSVNPFEKEGIGESKISEFIYEDLKSHNLQVEFQEVEENRKNVIATLKGKNPGPTLILNGHMDTVGVENMEIDPFKGEEDAKGNIFGRGAADMKGGLASMIVALETVADIVDPSKISGSVIFSAVVDEEYMGKGTKKFVEKYHGSGALVGEPTDLKIGIAHKGIIHYYITTHGKAVHGSVPELGVDAIKMMCSFVNALYSHRFTLEHPILGKPKLHASMISGGTEWSKVPDTCTLAVERRTLPGETWETVKEEINELICKASDFDKTFNASIYLHSEFPPMETDPQSLIVKDLSAAYKRLTSAETQLIGLPYWTDGATLSSKGIPTLIFGPGDISVAHSKLEYVSFNQVLLATNIYIDFILKWFGIKDAL